MTTCELALASSTPANLPNSPSPNNAVSAGRQWATSGKAVPMLILDRSGVRIHSGQKVELTLRPAAPDTGIVFRRTDLAELRRYISQLASDLGRVRADSGQIGGSVTTEFMALAEAGEAELNESRIIAFTSTFALLRAPVDLLAVVGRGLADWSPGVVRGGIRQIELDAGAERGIAEEAWGGHGVVVWTG